MLRQAAACVATTSSAQPAAPCCNTCDPAAAAAAAAAAVLLRNCVAWHNPPRFPAPDHGGVGGAPTDHSWPPTLLLPAQSTLPQDLTTGEWVVDSGVVCDYLETHFPLPALGLVEESPKM